VGASFPSDAKDSQVFADIPNAVAIDYSGADPITARPAYESTWKEHVPKMRLVTHSDTGKKAPQLREKSWGQVQQRLQRNGSVFCSR